MRTWDLRYEYNLLAVSLNCLIFLLEIISSFRPPSNLAGERQTGAESRRPVPMLLGWKYGRWQRYANIGIME